MSASVSTRRRKMDENGGKNHVELTIYVDVLWLRTFFVDLNVCLFVSLWLRIYAPVRRILWMNAAAVSAEVLLFVMAGYSVWYAIGAVVLRILLLVLLFRIRRAGRFFRIVGWSLLATMLAGGILACCQLHLPKSCWFGAGCVCCAAAVLYALVLEERRKQHDGQLYRIRLQNGGREISVVGLHDTGNRLSDPYVHLPVHLLARSELDRLMPERGSGRLVPFSAVGTADGLLEVWTADALEWENRRIAPVVIGAADERLFKGKDYRLILAAGWNNQME